MGQSLIYCGLKVCSSQVRAFKLPKFPIHAGCTYTHKPSSSSNKQLVSHWFYFSPFKSPRSPQSTIQLSKFKLQGILSSLRFTPDIHFAGWYGAHVIHSGDYLYRIFTSHIMSMLLSKSSHLFSGQVLIFVICKTY